MIFKLYRNSSKSNVVLKDIEEFINSYLYSLEEFSITEPIITIQQEVGSFTPFMSTGINYVMIKYSDEEQTSGISNRAFYYYISDIMFEYQGLVKLRLKIDYLMTFSTEIRNSISNGNAIITRDGRTSPQYSLFDDKVKFAGRSYKNQQIVRFPTNSLTWEDPYFVLSVAGSYGLFHSTETN